MENDVSDRLAGKRILVTGGAKGLGLACGRRFMDEGARVLLADIDAEAGEAAAELGGDRLDFVACDLSTRAGVAAAVDACADRLGGIDVLLNNAGIAVNADILSIDEETLDRVLAINLKAAFHGTQLAARRMIDQGGGGVILNMSSVNAVLNIPNLISYNISKGALNQLTRNSAIALAPHGIRVCGIGPGTILTEMVRSVILVDEAARRSVMSRTPIGRAGEPEEIASIAAFLASSDASYVTGETIYADGGRLGLNYTVAVE